MVSEGAPVVYMAYVRPQGFKFHFNVQRKFPIEGTARYGQGPL